MRYELPTITDTALDRYYASIETIYGWSGDNPTGRNFQMELARPPDGGHGHLNQDTSHTLLENILVGLRR